MDKLKYVSFDIEQNPHSEYMFSSYAGFKVDKSLLLSAAFYDHQTHARTVLHLDAKELKAYVDCDNIKDKDERLAAKSKKDKGLVSAVLQELNKYNVIVTWYGKRHDVKYINGKAAMHGLPYCYEPKHIDLFDTYKHKFSLSSNRLGNAAKIMGVKPKGEICPSRWSQAREGNYKALQEIADYNINDVDTLYELYQPVKEIISNHPHILALSDFKPKDRIKYCKWCGSDKITPSGSYITAAGVKKPRVKCSVCQPRKYI